MRIKRNFIIFQSDFTFSNVRVFGFWDSNSWSKIIHFIKFLWGLCSDRIIEQVWCWNFELKLIETRAGDGGSWLALEFEIQLIILCYVLIVSFSSRIKRMVWWLSAFVCKVEGMGLSPSALPFVLFFLFPLFFFFLFLFWALAVGPNLFRFFTPLCFFLTPFLLSYLFCFILFIFLSYLFLIFVYIIYFQNI